MASVVYKVFCFFYGHSWALTPTGASMYLEGYNVVEHECVVCGKATIKNHE